MTRWPRLGDPPAPGRRVDRRHPGPGAAQAGRPRRYGRVTAGSRAPRHARLGLRRAWRRVQCVEGDLTGARGGAVGSRHRSAAGQRVGLGDQRRDPAGRRRLRRGRAITRQRHRDPARLRVGPGQCGPGSSGDTGNAAGPSETSRWPSISTGIIHGAWSVQAWVVYREKVGTSTRPSNCSPAGRENSSRLTSPMTSVSLRCSFVQGRREDAEHVLREAVARGSAPGSPPACSERWLVPRPVA